MKNPDKMSMRELRAEVKSRRWISVEDRLPDEGIKVLTVGGDGPHVGFIKKGTWAREGEFDNYCLFDVTHWMPLPDAPF